ncbi:MAG: dTMP kinase [Planctomycetota bacterium]|nr:dTMP kinase [Planctomycetota bacterium]
MDPRHTDDPDASADPAARPGLFFVLDGLDGCGKSTQATRLAEGLRAAGRDVLHTREPGGTVLGERVRALLLDPGLGDLAPMAEVFLYQASRAQLVEEVIRPALARGTIVVCERWHYATTAYQGAYEGVGRGAGEEALRLSSELATAGVEPDRAVLLDMPSVVSDKRVGEDRDRLESRGDAYRRRVGQRFREVFAARPTVCRRVDAEGSIEEVAARIWEVVRDLLD